MYACMNGNDKHFSDLKDHIVTIHLQKIIQSQNFNTEIFAYLTEV